MTQAALEDAIGSLDIKQLIAKAGAAEGAVSEDPDILRNEEECEDMFKETYFYSSENGTASSNAADLASLMTTSKSILALGATAADCELWALSVIVDTALSILYAREALVSLLSHSKVDFPLVPMPSVALSPSMEGSASGVGLSNSVDDFSGSLNTLGGLSQPPLKLCQKVFDSRNGA